MSNPREDRRTHAPRRARAHLAALAGLLAIAAPAGACEDGDHLDVLTLNAWGLPAPIAPHRPARMAAIGRWLDELDVDVVGLQEVWTGAAPLLPAELVRAHLPGDDGLALRAAALSGVATLRFHHARGFDAFKRKGALRARIATGAGEVWVVDTHLQAGHGRANGRVRAAQLAELVAWLDEVDGPVVLLGDLNLDDARPEDALALERLDRAGFRDAATTLGHLQATYPGNGHRYDRILLRDGAVLALQAEDLAVLAYDDDPHTAAPTRLSDHLPVRARLRLVARR
ncbi:MAG: endonuclease/exonuclease/phosphatase family protein [Alphaproteobacteria bacterium]|nr:endonuclease/exonuclease/phosphatase family protein [Alphaproteobacteria bacterium]